MQVILQGVKKMDYNQFKETAKNYVRNTAAALTTIAALTVSGCGAPATPDLEARTTNYMSNLQTLNKTIEAEAEELNKKTEDLNKSLELYQKSIRPEVDSIKKNLAVLKEAKEAYAKTQEELKQTVEESQKSYLEIKASLDALNDAPVEQKK